MKTPIGWHFARHIFTYLLIFASIPLLIVGYIYHILALQIVGYVFLGLGLLFFLGYTLWALKREI
uniref:Uncharacterized protein n=1 Tax=viral metagenome TaxID=1070528 RepID=A0A6C0CKY1_9ZZZZ